MMPDGVDFVFCCFCKLKRKMQVVSGFVKQRTTYKSHSNLQEPPQELKITSKFDCRLLTKCVPLFSQGTLGQQGLFECQLQAA